MNRISNQKVQQTSKKGWILSLFVLFFCKPLFSQIQKTRNDTIRNLTYTTNGKDSIYYDTPPANVSLMDRVGPTFIGDKEKFIRDNLVYPIEAKKNQLEGYVTVYCQIDTNGIPEKVVIIRSTSIIFEQEAERIVRLMRWKWDDSEPNKKYWAEEIRIAFKL